MIWSKATLYKKTSNQTDDLGNPINVDEEIKSKAVVRVKSITEKDIEFYGSKIAKCEVKIHFRNVSKEKIESAYKVKISGKYYEIKTVMTEWRKQFVVGGSKWRP